jgi:spermidine/putrescine ABC transporter ATP-binding subunit
MDNQAEPELLVVNMIGTGITAGRDVALEKGVRVDGVTKRYGSSTAVDNVSISIEPGEFVTLLGPSGCGKSTLLRMISGFTIPDDGDIRIDGQSVVALPPFKRNTAMVFQDYALFPHRTVAQNLAFGLRMRRLPRPEIERRVDRMLEMIELRGLGDRSTDQISGGQAQRVALGRALIVEPALLLLDEPLGALDLKLRRQMQAELKRIQREMKLTFLYVTHDQEEALTMSDRIAVMRAGRVEQYAAPSEIYNNPTTAFVADFVGEANLLPAVVAEPSNGLVVVAGHELRVPPEQARGLVAGSSVSLAIRSEAVQLAQPGASVEPGLAGTVEEVLFAGSTAKVIVRFEGELTLIATLGAGTPLPERGQQVGVGWREADIRIVT